ncbi:Receptor-binding cancer antigen expressed on SiSo cells [Holothuria leucospilota]|uniref:Receptor-binding cancer antigen expressed on SiSo cells n=1 Tax=Holothuria leucospilota TaxID=206669 RepID=A0A9Q1H7J1_HOLLE|nr:Receptor-binding cancer antigen expressed on SiSo cells [Holothuria leucospilota]
MALRLNVWILCSCIAAVFSFIKRLLFRKSSKEKLDLPTTKRQGPEGQESKVEPEEELQNWDSWGDDGGGLTGVKVEPGEPHQQGNDETEPDFFADMTPNFKKAALIRKKHNKPEAKYGSSSAGGISSRLSLGVDDTANLTAKLGTWTESSGGWEDEAVDEDLELEADSVLKEKKEAERRKRIAEQQRKKAEREAQRANQKGASKLAVKLS